MEGKNILTIITIIISMACIAITLFLWYSMNTAGDDKPCVQRYDALAIKDSDNTTMYYYQFDVNDSNQTVTHENNNKPGTSEYTYTTIKLKGLTMPPTPTEKYIADLKNIYNKEKYSNCSSGKCNSQYNEWEKHISGKPCTNPNCKEHFNPKKYGLYNEQYPDENKGIVYINPESKTHEKYNSVLSTGIPKVDLKDKLRGGSSIIRGDVNIVPTGEPVVGVSRFRHESLTPALFY